MGTKDPRVDAYIARAAPFARPILAHLRGVVHAGCPDIRETIKWGAPSHRRDYVEWLLEAKRRDTRARRLATAIEWLTEGKRLNWRYESR